MRQLRVPRLLPPLTGDAILHDREGIGDARPAPEPLPNRQDVPCRSAILAGLRPSLDSLHRRKLLRIIILGDQPSSRHDTCMRGDATLTGNKTKTTQDWEWKMKITPLHD